MECCVDSALDHHGLDFREQAVLIDLVLNQYCLHSKRNVKILLDNLLHISLRLLLYYQHLVDFV